MKKKFYIIALSITLGLLSTSNIGIGQNELPLGYGMKESALFTAPRIQPASHPTTLAKIDESSLGDTPAPHKTEQLKRSSRISVEQMIKVLDKLFNP